jgi:23S rRNA pseudouridine1911/1915/1917 synthase
MTLQITNIYFGYRLTMSSYSWRALLLTTVDRKLKFAVKNAAGRTWHFHFSSIRGGATDLKNEKEDDVRHVVKDVKEVEVREVKEAEVKKASQSILIASNIDILYEDNHIIVCNKPNNLLSQGDHKTDEKDTIVGLVKAYIKSKYDKPGNVYLGLVHRIDRPCSGAMVFARTSKAAARLSEAFRERLMEKNYLCVVEGKLSKSGTIENYVVPIVNENTNEVKVRVQNDGPKNYFAKLAYSPLLDLTTPQSKKISGENGKQQHLTLVRVELETGRKHQIRAQLASIGHPLFGDSKYGSKNKMTASSIALHARELTIAHPITNKNMTFVAAVPDIWGETFDFSFQDYFQSANSTGV